MTYKRELAVIKSTKLGLERGLFTFWLSLDYGGSGQGTGGYSLDSTQNGQRVAWTGSTPMLRAVLRVCGVQSWESVAGCTVYALKDGGMVVGLQATGLHGASTDNSVVWSELAAEYPV